MPGESRASTVPATQQYLYPFTPQVREVDVIFQMADFYTQDGGGVSLL